MSSETEDLIVQLCTRAGMLMEDASPRAIGIGVRSGNEFASELDDLADKITGMSALIEAARMLIA